MSWYAVHVVATGELRSSGSSVAPAEELPEGWAVKEFTAQPSASMIWNPETLDWDIPRPVPAPRVDAPTFMQLFTLNERIAIRQANDPILEDFLDMVRVSQTFGLDHPMIADGLAYLVGQAIIDQARADQIAAGEPPA